MHKKIGFFLFAMFASLQAAEMGSHSEFTWIWIIMILLVFIAGGAIFVASKQSLSIKKFQMQLLQKQVDMEEKQNRILNNMSKEIENISKKSLEKSQEKIESSDKSQLEKERMMERAQERLLGVTDNLIDFMKLKSKRIEVDNKKFNLNNVLNEVSGMVCSRYMGKDVELIFEVDNSVPRYLIGDSLHFGRILNNIFEYMLFYLDDEELKLDVSMYNTYEDEIQLQFTFKDTGKGIPKETLKELFIPYYDEERGNYIGLGLFVAKSLAEMMGGGIKVQSKEHKGTTFILDLPFKMFDPENKRKYRLPDKILTEKKVVIMDSNYHSALAIKKMFAYFKHEVRILDPEDFKESMPNLEPYDIVVLNDIYFNKRAVNYIGKLKQDGKEFKVISLKNLMNIKEGEFKDAVIDIQMYKPLNQERVFELIIDLYDISVKRHLLKDTEAKREKAKVIKSHFNAVHGTNKESFADFGGKNLLLVEDNVINQQVLLNLLGQSGMHIYLANNGEEAIEMVKFGDTVFDMVLMDINMPVMDGFSATKAIREDNRFDSLPIIAFTALILQSEIQKIFKSGMNAYLAKPLNIGSLYALFSSFFSVDLSKQQHQSKEEGTEIIDGLDIQKGIQHANNSEALYIELIKEFREAYSDIGQTLELLAEEKRYEQLKMLCIDLRGLAGTIGADDLYAMVNEVHQFVMYKKYGLLDKSVQKCVKEISRVNQSIESYIFSHVMLVS